MLNVVADGDALGDREPLTLWSCHLDSWSFFGAVQTQWRVGFGGREGLDYGAVEIVMKRRRIPEDQRDRLFADLQVIEMAALAAWSEKRA